MKYFNFLSKIAPTCKIWSQKVLSDHNFFFFLREKKREKQKIKALFSLIIKSQIDQLEKNVLS